MMHSEALHRPRRYLTFLVIFMGLVAIMDQYLSTIKMTAMPYILKEYNLTAAEFHTLETFYLILTFLVFLLNGLNDLIGRKWAILILILMMGLSSLGVVFFTPAGAVHPFMLLYAVIILTTVSNMWSIAPSEESPAASRGKMVAIVYVISMIPLQALMPPLLLNVFHLDWRWMYGVMFIFMLPVLGMWFKMKETLRFQAIRADQQAGMRKRHFYGLGSINRRDVWYILVSASIWICWLIHNFMMLDGGNYFMGYLGYSLGDWSLVLLGVLLMVMAGGVTGGWLMDKLGRNWSLVLGSLGVLCTTSFIGLAPAWLAPVLAILSGFFTSVAYIWIIVYIPEVFPERRGACMGWTTTVARFGFVLGPAIAALLVAASPRMEWYWIFTGAIMVVPILIIKIFNPYETRLKELEEIETKR
jgi:MFS family permease